MPCTCCTFILVRGTRVLYYQPPWSCTIFDIFSYVAIFICPAWFLVYLYVKVLCSSAYKTCSHVHAHAYKPCSHSLFIVSQVYKNTCYVLYKPCMYVRTCTVHDIHGSNVKKYNTCICASPNVFFVEKKSLDSSGG